MRFTTIAQLALAAAPALVSADTGSLGFALGAKTAGGSCKGPSDYAADLDFLHKQTGTTIVRGYSATSCNEDGSCCNFAANILPVAREKGFQVIIGIWPDDPVSLQKEKDALTTLVPQFKDVIYAVTVGSESLYRRALTGEQLNNIIGDVKSLIGSDIKVGSADSWNNYTDFAASPLYGDNGHATILLVNAFPYWQGQEISNASRTLFDDLGQAFDLIQSKKPDMEIWVGETGWPSAGTDYHAAKSGLDNAHQFWQEGICSLLTWGFNTFAFEAFDESWKPITKGLDGTEADETNWGVFKADYSIKYDLECPAASDSE
ncbi:MAG: glycoside hydrolase 3 protein [Candelina submexicana]|nr:MAG: glycoside hydrolase 3 protein [Candelina submexicana]